MLQTLIYIIMIKDVSNNSDEQNILILNLLKSLIRLKIVDEI
jgi:hypothetical protein